MLSTEVWWDPKGKFIHEVCLDSKGKFIPWSVVGLKG